MITDDFNCARYRAGLTAGVGCNLSVDGSPEATEAMRISAATVGSDETYLINDLLASPPLFSGSA
jgi:hypothetical protein